MFTGLNSALPFPLIYLKHLGRSELQSLTGSPATG
jgi:hypothetical protein